MNGLFGLPTLKLPRRNLRNLCNLRIIISSIGNPR
jgi:hypothetical protein